MYRMRHALLPAGLEPLHSHLVPQPALMMGFAESNEAQLHGRKNTYEIENCLIVAACGHQYPQSLLVCLLSFFFAALPSPFALGDLPPIYFVTSPELGKIELNSKLSAEH